MYCDASVDTEGEFLVGSHSRLTQLFRLRPSFTDESYHVCHEGYISLFPLLLSLLEPSSPHLGSVLSLLRDPEQLWSPYGIRSLSKSHPLFGKGEDYWRGPIWIQMNYLALGALYNVSPSFLYYSRDYVVDRHLDIR